MKNIFSWANISANSKLAKSRILMNFVTKNVRISGKWQAVNAEDFSLFITYHLPLFNIHYSSSVLKAYESRVCRVDGAASARGFAGVRRRGFDCRRFF